MSCCRSASPLAQQRGTAGQLGGVVAVLGGGLSIGGLNAGRYCARSAPLAGSLWAPFLPHDCRNVKRRTGSGCSPLTPGRLILSIASHSFLGDGNLTSKRG